MAAKHVSFFSRLAVAAAVRMGAKGRDGGGCGGDSGGGGLFCFVGGGG